MLVINARVGVTPDVRYTVPTAGLYPFQWNWDAGFAALGWARIDEGRAWDELDTLLSTQWPSGKVAHIAFHVPVSTYFPGPEAWGTHQVPPTSGITQPNIIPIVCRHLLSHATDLAASRARVRRLLPKLVAWSRWLSVARDPDGSGVPAVLHPWETGLDNSPAWDASLAAVATGGLEPYQRRDTAFVDASERPTADDYDRYMATLQALRRTGWDDVGCWSASPFRVVDVGFAALCVRSDLDLAWLAHEVGDDELAAEAGARGARGVAGLEGLWDHDANAYRSHDLRAGTTIPIDTVAGFLPLLCGVAPDRAAASLAHLRSWGDKVDILCPSLDPDHPAFDARRYWRGPVWINVNWLVASACAVAGDADLVARMAADTSRLISNAGLREYYDPRTGEGRGGRTFTWTASTAIAWSETGLLDA